MSFPEMLYTIDILFVLFVLFFAVRGVWNGLSGELANVVTLIALLTGFCFFYPQLEDLAKDHWNLPNEALRFIVPTVLILASVILFFLLRILFRQMLKDLADTKADKIGGVLVGMLRGILLGLTVFVGLSLIPNDTLYRVLSDKSAVGGWVCKTLTPWAAPRISELPALRGSIQNRIDDVTQ